ncbi:MAG: deoxyribose-phosphate aldolase [Myxococcales bacterium]|nr:deoxyribose-phosphate aldolase [Myxococcales bacterium]
MHLDVEALAAELARHLRPASPDAPPLASVEPAPLRTESPRSDLRLLIDHTLLAPDAGHERLAAHCDEAMEHGFWSVCVASTNVAFVRARLAGSGVRVCSVVGFPHGNGSPAAKAAEAAQAVRDGADELDTVIQIGALKDGDHAKVYDDLRAVVDAAQGRIVKVILETALLDEREKIIGCALSKAAGAGFVKTSTGFAAGGATTEDIALFRSVVGTALGVKASGGIRDAATADAMIAAGASRIGCSESVAIIGAGAAAGTGY